MTPEEILAELERRMRWWEDPYDGWYEQAAGFSCALTWIGDMRAGRESTDDMFTITKEPRKEPLDVYIRERVA
jgi:hypothetical protein